MDLFLDFPFCSIDLCFCFCASMALSWRLRLCSRAWSQASWLFQFHSSFSRLLWLFEVFCISIQMVKLFVLVQCSCLENPRDEGAWWAAIYGVTQSRTRLKWLSSRMIIAFLPRNKRLLISWLQSPSAVILEPKKIKSDTVSTVFPSIPHEVVGPDAMIFVFWMLSLKPTFSLSTFTFIKRLFSSSSLSAIW